MTRSIQTKLTLALTVAAIALSAGMGVLLYRLISHEMVENFDRGLRSKGQAIVSLVSLEDGGVLDFEFNEAAMPEYRPGKHADYFQIWFADGKPYARAKSLGDAELNFAVPSNQKNAFYDLELPDRRIGRAIRISFVPQSEQPPPAPAKPMVALIARDRSELDESLAHLGQSLAATTLIFGIATALASIWIVRRSLRPLRLFAEQAAAINATSLNSRLNQPLLPAELIPIRDRLNDLLSRLEDAFARERRFTSDVAHELRTPIAELRSIVEVAMTWPDDPEATQAALSDSFAIAVQMQTLVNTLLSLVRADQRFSGVVLQTIELAPFVDETLAKLRAAAAVCDVELSIPDDAAISAEPALLSSVLTNLLLNASEYCSEPQKARCSARVEPERVLLMVENQTDNLTAEDVSHLFDPFWRKDGSRTNPAHAGLGLSLVRAYCHLMDIEVTAALEGSTLQLSLACQRAIPAAAESPPNRAMLPAAKG